MIPVYLSYFPAGASVKQLYHYAQEINSGINSNKQTNKNTHNHKFTVFLRTFSQIRLWFNQKPIKIRTFYTSWLQFTKRNNTRGALLLPQRRNDFWNCKYFKKKNNLYSQFILM